MSPPRILIVDDQPPIITMLQMALKRIDCEVLVAHDGAEALRIFACELPDLVTLDLNMPEVPGWEVCARIKAMASTPVIIITGQVTTELRASELAPGADAYLLKPFDIGDLLANVRRLLPQENVINGCGQT
jgi:DNA-binding response OmpR family regulator